MQFLSSHPKYEYLRKKWINRHKNLSEKFLEKHGSSLKHVTLGGLSGLLLLTTPGGSIIPVQLPQAEGQGITATKDQNRLLATQLKKEVPEEVRLLTVEEEARITKILSTKLGFSVKAELEGYRLNRSYGLIGGEQHLYRYPSDNLFKHADSASDWAMYGSSGIAPGLGAYGYFASSEVEFSQKDKLKERYYIAVQTFLAPGFSENVGKYRDFLRYRKMLVINPQTGQLVVTVIGDAGPAEWTGKHLGGSPEVMHYLGLAKGPRKGPVLYFFLDDPEDKIPLGPIIIKDNNLAAGGII